MRARSTCAVLIAGAVLAGGADASTALAAPGRAGASIVVVGGNRAQRELARITARRVGGSTVARVVFRAPIGALRHEHMHGTEMIVASRGKRTLRSIWEQQLFVGTYLGLMRRWQGAGIAGAATSETEGTVSQLRAYDVFGSNPKAIKVATLTRNLFNRSVLERAHIVGMETIATPARLVALTVRVSDPASFLKHRAARLLNLFWHPSIPLLGFYFGVEDSTGALVFATSRLPNTGGVFVIRSLDSCSPVSHGEVAGLQPPPPCPAP
jgi:hypothetical protein